MKWIIGVALWCAISFFFAWKIGTWFAGDEDEIDPYDFPQQEGD